MNIAKQVRAAVVARDKRVCKYCGKANLGKTQLQLDHVHPECKDGQFSLDNLVVACKQCNHRKGKKPLADYITHRLVALELEIRTLKNIQNLDVFP